MRNRASLLLLAVVFACASLCITAPSACLAGADDTLAVKARRILSDHCFACHGPDEAERQSGLRLDTAEGLRTPADSGDPPVVPGKPEASELVRRISSEEEWQRMPPPEFGKPLQPAEIDILTRWVAAGAELPAHWAYVPPQRPALPSPDLESVPMGVDPAAWLQHPVDRFVLEKMLDHDLMPSPPASRREFLRRVTLDLTGLPPTEEQLAAFEQDSRPDAFERVVDRLLASPAYGEHWGAKWLDLARYADSAGYADDPPRTIWAYRDWVITALNDNMPIDLFTIKQLAGDLLPDPTTDDLIATAFHRNTMTNNEGGTDDEEFRNVAVVDRVNTTMQVWMGTTFGCAQCHSHKYDPFSQKEYFQLFAIFNQTADADRRDEAPVIQVYSIPQRLQRDAWKRRLAQLQDRLENPGPQVTAELEAWLASLRQPEFDRLGQVRIVAPGGETTAEERFSVASPERQASDDKAQAIVVRVPLERWQGRKLTAIQLTAAPGTPGEHDGRTPGSPHAVELAEIAAWIEPSAAHTPPAARFVRIELPGENKILSLAEVQVWSGGENVALAGKASQSSVDYGGEPQRAIDGNTSGNYDDGSVTHTARSNTPWWEVDLGKPTVIDRLVVWNRNGGGIHRRLDGARVLVLDEKRKVLFEQRIAPAPETSVAFDVRPMHPVVFSAVEAAGGSSSPTVLIDHSLDGAWALIDGQGSTKQLNLALSEHWQVESGHVLRLELRLASKDPLPVGWEIAVGASDEPTAGIWIGMEPEIRRLVAQSDARWSDEDKRRLAAWFARRYAETTRELREEMERLQAALDSQKPETTVPVMQERQQPRETYVQIRGNFQVLGERVEPGTPAALHPLPDGTPKIDRLALARWLVDRRNPLTARVWVNRLWESLFGRGIVLTSEEFGAQGTPPTHPQLLDWLAVELMDSGWDQKHLLRLLVLSQTYRQSSRVTPAHMERDADNVWLARGPRVRMTAEMIRDHALAAGGLLSRKMFGPPVRPPQPNLGLKAAFGSATDWQPSNGEDRYRRGLYTFWRRSNPYPSMATFDAPTREVCSLRRASTNTPLQALVTLNDPCFVEAAQGLARLVGCYRKDLVDDQQRLSVAFERCTGRIPEQRELEVLTQLLNQLREKYNNAPWAAEQLATDPIGPVPDGADPVELAALTAVCNVILNLDEVVLKR